MEKTLTIGKNKISVTNQTIGNMFIILGIVIITTLEWHIFDWYQSFTKYGTLITFVCLLGTFFCYVKIKDAIKDKFFWLVLITGAIALANLFIIGSNKGSILIVADFLLILYLADKVVFSKLESYFVLAYSAFFFFYWTVDVKGYFKGYNTNYGGLILITGFACLLIILQVTDVKMSDRYKTGLIEQGYKEGKKNWWKKNWWYPLLYLFFVALAFNIISWYRSRTALMGLIVLLAIVIFPEKFIKNKVVYILISVFATLGSIAFTGIYILFGKSAEGGLQLFYKSVVSGRDEIWTELWEAFLANPITGVGSSYKMKLDFMEGMFEAHGAMMDILVVHGIIVFIPVCGLLLYRILKLREQTSSGTVGIAIFAAVICVLVTGFFENYYIVQPFSLILLSLFAIKPSALS